MADGEFSREAWIPGRGAMMNNERMDRVAFSDDERVFYQAHIDEAWEDYRDGKTERALHALRMMADLAWGAGHAALEDAFSEKARQAIEATVVELLRRSLSACNRGGGKGEPALSNFYRRHEDFFCLRELDAEWGERVLERCRPMIEANFVASAGSAQALADALRCAQWVDARYADPIWFQRAVPDQSSRNAYVTKLFDQLTPDGVCKHTVDASDDLMRLYALSPDRAVEFVGMHQEDLRSRLETLRAQLPEQLAKPLYEDSGDYFKFFLVLEDLRVLAPQLAQELARPEDWQLYLKKVKNSLEQLSYDGGGSLNWWVVRWARRFWPSFQHFWQQTL